MSSASVVWHYTVGAHLHAIEQAGALLPARAPYACSGSAVLWFSRQSWWEPSAASFAWKRVGAAHVPPPASLAGRQGLYRFGLRGDDARLAPWPAITRIARIGIPETMAMTARGLQQGATPTDWCGTLDAVPLADLRFQMWDGMRWQDASLADCAGQSRSAPAPAAQPVRPLPAVQARPRFGGAHDLH